jgi:hypothetical protein
LHTLILDDNRLSERVLQATNFKVGTVPQYRSAP